MDALLVQTLRDVKSHIKPTIEETDHLPILIYGTGKVGEAVYRVLAGRALPILGFMDHLRLDSAPVLNVPLYLPDDPRLSLPTREMASVILAIHNREVDMLRLTEALSRLGYRNLVPMIDLYDHFAGELGTRYWLTSRMFYPSCQPRIALAYDLLADEPSKSIFSAVLRFRMTGDFSLLPLPDKEHQYCPPDLPVWATPLRLVDCGAYDGDSIKGFLQAGLQVEAVAAFEPDPDNFARLTQFVLESSQHLKEAYLWPCAAHSSTCHARFERGRGEANAISADGDTHIQCVALDDVIPYFGPNLVKLDVEGSEHEVLLGARRMIASNAPGLAICAYHRPEDLWEIPLLIEELIQDGQQQMKYKYYLRGHAYSGFDLVLYACPVDVRDK